MNIEGLNKSELLELKEAIDNMIKELDKPVKLDSKLSKCNKIYCIIFDDSKIYIEDYVDISFGESKNGYTNFSCRHKTKTMGCSASIRDEYMDKSYFLFEFCNSMYFFTLKPESWKEDILQAMETNIEYKNEYFEKDILKFKHKITGLINKGIE